MKGCARVREDHIQAALCQHLAVRAAAGVVYWHTPNGGARRPAEAGRFRALGVKAGIPDLLLLRHGQLFGLELKAIGGRLSARQVETLEQLEHAGAMTAVAYGLDEALMQLTSWGLLRNSAHSSAATMPAQERT